MNKLLSKMKSEVFDCEYKDMEFNFIRHSWIRNRKVIYIFHYGNEWFTGNFFDDLYEIYDDQFFVIAEPDKYWSFDEKSLIIRRFRGYGDYHKTMIDNDFLFFENHIMFSRNLDIIFYIVEEKHLVVAGDESKLKRLFSMSLKQNKKQYLELLCDDHEDPFASYYWKEA